MIAMEPAGYRTSPVIWGSNRMVIHMFSKLATSDTEELSECEALRHADIFGCDQKESFGR